MLDTFWNDILSDLDKTVIKRAGYHERGASTFSSRQDVARPALLIIDMQVLFVGDDVPIMDAIATAPTMIGERGWRAIETMMPLIKTCRDANIPVIYAKMLPHNRPTDDPLLEIVDPLTPTSTDIIIEKSTSSPFFQTQLDNILQEHECDSVIVTGNSTSGCVRAAAVDAVQRGLSVIVPHDCVFDRIEASHKISLLDMWMKYATVESATDTIERIHHLQQQAEVSG